MNIKKILIFGGAALALVGLSVGGSLFLTGEFDKNSAPDMGAAMLDENGEVIAPMPVLSDEVFYHNIQPEFVVNFYGKTRAQFMMIEMVVGTYDEKLIPVLTDHDPEIRDAMLTLLSDQDSEALKTAPGKQALRKQVVEKLDEIVGLYYRTGRIKDVYITRLVMQ